MARRENQGLHIALISCVIMSVMFMVLTYYYLSQRNVLRQQLDGSQKKITELNQEKGKATLDAEQLKSWLGYPAEADVQGTIKADYEKDMLTYGQSLPDVQRNYRELPAHLLAVNQERHQRIASQAEDIRKLTTELENTRKQKNAEVATAKQAHAKAVAELNRITDQNQQQVAKLSTDKASLLNKANEERQLREQEVGERDSKIAGLENKVKDVSAIAERRQIEIAKLTQLTFDTPDGRVTSVNPRTKTAFINLGKSDGLRSQVTFSVFGVDVNNLAKEAPKGSVEVVQVISDHRSEVRITDDNIDDPILKNDVIYTPVWDAKSALRFALLGKMDINEDSKDDRQIVKNLINLNNGKIDAEDVNGEMVGRLTRNTKYLIIGDNSPDIESVEDDTESARSGRVIRTQMINEARALGIQEISLDEILKFMGYNGERRIIPLGKRSRAEDFKAKPGDRSVRSTRRSAYPVQ